MTTYKTLSARIRAASSKADLTQCETQITRHYDNGTLTVSEFMRLDVLIMEREALL